LYQLSYASSSAYDRFAKKLFNSLKKIEPKGYRGAYALKSIISIGFFKFLKPLSKDFGQENSTRNGGIEGVDFMPLGWNLHQEVAGLPNQLPQTFLFISND